MGVWSDAVADGAFLPEDGASCPRATGGFGRLRREPQSRKSQGAARQDRSRSAGHGRRIAENADMSKPITLTITHHLGRAEALSRVKSGVESAKSTPLPLSVEYAEWQDNIMNFRIRALGVNCLGTITVLDETVRLDLVLPAVLGFVADKVISVVRARAQILLGQRR
jgi:hypothetical protein